MRASTALLCSVDAMSKGDPPLWPLFLVNYVEESIPGEALTFAVDFVRTCLQEALTPQVRKYTTWLSHLEALSEQSDFSCSLPDVCDEWENDDLSKAIERLYGAKQRRLMGDELGYRKLVALALLNAVSGVKSQSLNTPQALIEKFRERYHD